MNTRCYAPACRCASPCGAYYANEGEPACPGWRDCAGCYDCEETAYRYSVVRARKDRVDAEGYMIRAGERYLLVESTKYRVGGPIVRRWKRARHLTASQLARWEAAGRPRYLP